MCISLTYLHNKKRFYFKYWNFFSTFVLTNYVCVKCRNFLLLDPQPKSEGGKISPPPPPPPFGLEIVYSKKPGLIRVKGKRI